jgi:ABC-type hemin transport system ATPase subunit
MLVALDDVTLGYDGRPVVEHASRSASSRASSSLLVTEAPARRRSSAASSGSSAALGPHHLRLRPPPRAARLRPAEETLDPIFPLTVAEVVVMGTYARLAPLRPVGRRRARRATCLDRVGLAHLAGHAFWTLSGRTAPRADRARRSRRATLLLLDEPTAGIDPGAEAGIMETHLPPPTASAA